eukprot:CCRYP_018656-RA/>CCRYP_018656-RA protein AED:0.25 eAED:0.42 QI:0/0/0/1/0/0/2/0/273
MQEYVHSQRPHQIQSPAPQKSSLIALQGSHYLVWHQGTVHCQTQFHSSSQRSRRQMGPMHCRCSPLLCTCSRQQIPPCPQQNWHPTSRRRTEATNTRVNHLLDYSATYPNDGISYRASNMILAAHSDAAYLNVSKARSCTSTHIILSKDIPTPSYNIPIINFAASSTAEAELMGLYICAKEMVPLCNSLVDEMGWPQPTSPIQTHNTTALGVANKIITRKMKSMDMCLWWLRCRKLQVQFCYFWDPSPTNYADYPRKAHSNIYHESMRHTQAG